MEPLLGQIDLLPYNFVPKGWMACSGQQLHINQWQALFSLLGTTFGLPNLQGKAPASSLQYCIAVVGVFPSRD